MTTKPGAVMDDKKERAGETPAETAAMTKSTRPSTPAVIQTPDEYFSSVSTWQQKNFHVLSPVVQFTSLPAQHAIVASFVQLDPNPENGEVYSDPLFCKNGEVAIAKIGLSKIAQAAGMTIKTERTDPRTIQNYWEVRATARYLGLDGNPQELDATVEYDLRDSSPRVRSFSDKQKAAARTHGLRGAEARAINAAIRLFGIKQKYSIDELRKPFVALRVLWQPDMKDPEQARIVTQQKLQGTTSLYPHVGGTNVGSTGPQVIDVIGETSSPAPRPVGSSAAPTTTESARAPQLPEGYGVLQAFDAKTLKRKKDGAPFTKWIVVDHAGVEHVTTDDEVFGPMLKRVWETKAPVKLTSEENNYGENDIANIDELGAPAKQQQGSLLPDPNKL